MNLIRHFSEQLRKGYEDDPWHGPSTRSLLEALTAEQAASHPIAGFHSIWEIVLHMDAWQREVYRRMNGSQPDLPAEGDWRKVVEINDDAWNLAQEALNSSLHEILRAVESLAESSFEQQIGQLRDRELGTGITAAAMLSGLIQHNAYHSGQIALLRKNVERQ